MGGHFYSPLSREKVLRGRYLKGGERGGEKGGGGRGQLEPQLEQRWVQRSQLEQQRERQPAAAAPAGARPSQRASPGAGGLGRGLPARGAPRPGTALQPPRFAAVPGSGSRGGFMPGRRFQSGSGGVGHGLSAAGAGAPADAVGGKVESGQPFAIPRSRRRLPRPGERPGWPGADAAGARGQAVGGAGRPRQLFLGP